MKAYSLSLLALVAFVGAGIWLAASRPTAPVAPPSSPVARAEPRAEPASPVIVLPARASRGEPASPGARGAGASAPDASTMPAAKFPAPLTDAHAAGQRVQLLTATFDPEHIPELVAYLKHPVPEVRQQALMALVMLGEPEAAPLIRAVATTAAAEEASLMRDAADQLARIRSDEPRMPRVSLAELERSRPRRADQDASARPTTGRE